MQPKGVCAKMKRWLMRKLLDLQVCTICLNTTPIYVYDVLVLIGTSTGKSNRLCER